MSKSTNRSIILKMQSQMRLREMKLRRLSTKIEEWTIWALMKAQKEKIILKEKRQTHDLIFLSVLFILAMCLLESTMNLSKWLKLIGTRTCFLDGLLVVILSLGLFFLDHYHFV